MSNVVEPDATTIHPAPRLKEYLSYGVGMTGNQILRDIPTAMLLFYMTNTLGISPAYAGFALLLPKIWIIIADPLVGSLSDRTRSRWGARKPYLLAGAIVSFIGFVMLFNLAVPASPLLATVLIGVLYLITATGYSMFSVPYLTLAAEIGDEPHQRTTALAYKQYFCLVGVLAGLSLAPWLIAVFGGDKAAYGRMAWIVGLIMLATMVATALLVPVRAARVEPAPVTGHLGRQVRAAFGHRPFRIIFGAATLQLLAAGITQAGMLFFITYIMRLNIEALGAVILVSVVGSAIAQTFWLWLAKRIGTVPAYRVGSFYAACVALGMLLLPRGEAMPYIVYGLLSGSAASGSTMLSFAALIEAIALDGPDSQRKGLFASIYTASEKALMAFGGFLLAAALAFAHFVQGAPREIQPSGALLAIVVSVVIIPAVMNFISVWVLGRYPKARPAEVALPIAPVLEVEELAVR